MAGSSLVSVLMTAHNRQNFIAQAMESVLASSYRDLELIVVDDCSDDSTLEIAERFKALDRRVSVYRNSRRPGDYPNRNQAATYAKGRYLKYLDSDEVIYPPGLEVMVRSMESFPQAGLGLCAQGDSRGPYPICLEPRDAYLEHTRGTDLFGRAPASAIMSREAFEKVGGFSGRRQVGDSEMWLAIASRFAVVKMPRDLVWDRVHGEQEMFEDSPEDRLRMQYEVAVDAMRSPGCPLSPEERTEALESLRGEFIRTIIDQARTIGNWGLAWRCMRACRISSFEAIRWVCRRATS